MTRIDFSARDVNRGGNKLILFPEGEGSTALPRAPRFKGPGSRHGCRLRLALMTATILAGAATLAILPVGQALAQVDLDDVDVTVPGTHASPWAPGDLRVGLSSTASLTISGGGIVNLGRGTIGRNPGSDGTVTVTGAGSEWNMSIWMAVGVGGSGTLIISNGGLVNVTGGAGGSAGTWIGEMGGSDGTITVTGAGSSLVDNGQMRVGVDGSGTLLIENGGTVSNTIGRIGMNAGSSGMVTVTGADSIWTNSSELLVGQSGTGTMLIADGGVVSNTWSRIGLNAGSIGAVTVTGAGSEWINTGDLFIGQSGTGTLTISNGGLVTAPALFVIASQAGSTGTLNIGAAAGDAAAVAGTLDTAAITLGSGNATLVFNHTEANYELDTAISGNGTIRLLAGRTTLSGANTYTGSTLLEGGTLTLGSNAALGGSTLRTLGSVVDYTHGLDITNSIIIDSNTTQFQVLAGATATQSGVISEDNGPRPFEKIGDGELILTAANTWTGETTIADGTLTFDGGSVALAAAMFVARQNGDDATLNIINGGSVGANGVILAENAGSTGTLNFGAAAGDAAAAAGTLDTPTIAFGTGTGTVVFNHTDDDFELDADISGNGTIRLLAGRTILSGNSSYTGSTLLEGGTLTLGSDNALGGSTLRTLGSVVDYADGVDISNAIVIDSNTTQFQVLAGATATQSGVISEDNGPRPFEKIGDGELILTAANTWTGDTTVTDGTLTFDGGSVALGAGQRFYVGRLNGDSGTLRIENGGSVSNFTGSIGGNAGSNGTVLVTGAGSTWTNSFEIFVGAGGNGTLLIEDGGRVLGADDMFVAFGSGSTGIVRVTGADSLLEIAGLLVIGRSGDGSLIVEAGGSASANVLSVGNRVDGSGTVRIAGTGSSLTAPLAVAVGNFDGDGSLVVEGGATLSTGFGLVGYDSDDGPTTGHVLVSGPGSRWFLSDFTFTDGFTFAGLYLGFGDGDTGTLTIAEDGEVSSENGITLARFTGSTGTLNIGAAAGGAAAGAGTLDSDTLEFGLGLGRLVFNHTASSGGAGHVFGADITSDAAGDALIHQLAGFTRLTGDSAGYQGDVEVSGGMLSVDGTLGAGDVTTSVTSGGALTGSGILDGDVTIGAGGILAGQSGQTFTVGGDLALDEDALVNVALGAPGGSELFSVGGDLTLDGTLNISDAGGFGPGLYALFTYGGALTDNGLALGVAPVAGLLPGELTVQTSIAGQVNLVSSIGVDLLFWDGDAPANALNGAIDGGDGVWTANAFNFTDTNGLVSGPSRPTPGFIVFAGAAGNVTVDDSEGDIEIAGAQFAVDGYVIDGDGITLAGNGAGEAIFRVGNGTGAGASFTAAIGSDLSGDAALVKTDLGTLILTGSNSYTGGTAVHGGTLVGSTSSIIGDIANDGVVVFDQAGDAALDQDLSGDGLFRFTGGAEYTLGAGNSYAGGTEVSGAGLVLTGSDSAGTGGIALSNAQLTYSDGLTIANGLALAGTNSLIVSAGSATHAGSVAGSGSFTLGGAGTLVFAGNGSAFTGQTTITGNVLMNGILGGNIEVADGGILRGFGTLGSTRLLSGSTIAPGNSVGTLTIDGDLVFETGSVYALTVLNDGSMDLIEVSGTAAIASGAVLTPSSLTGLTFGTRNVILTASGGVTGTFQFDEAISNLAFVSSGLETSANEVVLFFDRNDTPFETLASGANDASAARAADALGAGNPLWEALVWLDAASAPAAFEALNGEIHATHRQLVLDDTIHTRRAVTSRLAAARGEEAGSAWISGHFGGAQFGSRAGVSRVSADSSGVMLGLDTPVNGHARIGVMAAFGETSFNLTGRNAAGLSESRSLGVYGGTQLGALGVSAGAIYGWHDLSTNRRVSFPGINEQISSSHSADTIQLFGEASLSGPAGLEPFLSLAHVRLDTGSFREAGGVSALALDGETRQMTQGTLGSRFAHDWQAGETALRFEGSLGWRRVFSGHRQFVSGNLSGAPVFFEGNGVDRDAAAIEAGIHIEPMGRMSLELGYAGEIGSNARNHGAEFRARWAF